MCIFYNCFIFTYIFTEKRHPNGDASTIQDVSSLFKQVSKHFRDKHQGLFQYNCQSCDYGNDDRARFAYHMYKKHGGVEIEGIVKCPNAGCKYVAPQKCILVTHLETCGEDKQNKKHMCDQCEKGYRSRKYLNLHKAADHPEEGADVRQFPVTTQAVKKYTKALMLSEITKISKLIM